jgi:hypothetical protein
LAEDGGFQRPSWVAGAEVFNGKDRIPVSMRRAELDLEGRPTFVFRIAAKDAAGAIFEYHALDDHIVYIVLLQGFVPTK